MELYLVVPEVMDTTRKCGTDLISGHMDELELYQRKEDADAAAYRLNTRFKRNMHKHTVIGIEVN